ncbi:hypothetical protein ABBQ32_008981 [Trebouxia sp. C0010 RCD-2024]
MLVGRPPCCIPSADTASHQYSPRRQCRACLRKQHGELPPRMSRVVKAQGLDYKQAGVDIDAGAELVRRIQKLNPSIGGFSGLVPFGDSFLVAGTDGVGTKLKLAFDMNTHDTIGIDLVAMSVNDIITSGAKPMFFLDYYATAKLDVDVAEATAEMPGLYQPGEYDVAGFAVGSVKQDRVIDGKQIQEGDVLIALPSSGLHSNGFSLVRKVLEVSGKNLQDPVPWGGSGSLGQTLLEPTLIYVKRLLALTDATQVKGCVHITGGGFTENLPRVMPEGLACEVQSNSWEWPPLFQWLQEAGNIATQEMYRTFNMGVGMVVIVPPSEVEKALATDGAAFVLGSVIKGKEVNIV